MHHLHINFSTIVSFPSEIKFNIFLSLMYETVKAEKDFLYGRLKDGDGLPTSLSPYRTNKKN